MTALASYLTARSHNGAWLLRIDDLDTQRVAAGAEREILLQLESHGLTWDEKPRRQSEHLQDYRAALQQLIATGDVYACDCTRAELAFRSLRGPDGLIYDGRCRDRKLDFDRGGLRIRMPDRELQFEDSGQGVQRRHLRDEIGDFVLRRRDGTYSYQLACAVDEQEQGISEVLRGADLLSSSFMQLHLAQKLGLPAPCYHHIAVLVDSAQRKLSKQNHALAVRVDRVAANLVRCLELLGQIPPPALLNANKAEILAWALEHWNPAGMTAGHQVELRSL